jgi:hypothetical protein
MKWDSRFKGQYISAAELGNKRPTMTILKVAICKTDDEKKKREVEKPVIFFKEVDRGWMYSKTAGHCLAAMFGGDDDNWVGKRVTLYADEDVYFGSEQVGGIRVAGSPDIQKPMTIRIKFPKKKAMEVTLQPTKNAAPASPSAASTAVPIT